MSNLEKNKLNAELPLYFPDRCQLYDSGKLMSLTSTIRNSQAMKRLISVTNRIWKQVGVYAIPASQSADLDLPVIATGLHFDVKAWKKANPVVSISANGAVGRSKNHADAQWQQSFYQKRMKAGVEDPSKVVKDAILHFTKTGKWE